MQRLFKRGIPRGLISLWSGNIASVPKGWQFCDGTNGTPDLSDKFVVGAKQDDGGVAKTNITGALLPSGGDTSHNHGGTDPVTHIGQLQDGTGLAFAPLNHSHGISNDDHIPTFYALAYIMKL